MYERHVFVCTADTDWPARIELGGGFLQALAEAIADRSEEISRPVKLTACQDQSSDNSGHDLLIFPDKIRYLNVRESDFPDLVESHLVGNRICETPVHTSLSGQHVFVCVHQSRDPRCGACGPPLADLFTHKLQELGLDDSVFVRRTSHVGGHRFAGNVLFYPGGDWYGHVTPADVSRIVESHIVQGAVLPDLWRGRMGMSAEEQIRLVQERRGGESRNHHDGTRLG